jgi:hypothetical protein
MKFIKLFLSSLLIILKYLMYITILIGTFILGLMLVAKIPYFYNLIYFWRFIHILSFIVIYLAFWKAIIERFFLEDDKGVQEC